jgi:hypothetical protein
MRLSFIKVKDVPLANPIRNKYMEAMASPSLNPNSITREACKTVERLLEQAV